VVGSRFGWRIVKPERPGVAGTCERMLDLGSLDFCAVVVAPWADQHVGRVFASALYLVAEEQSPHRPFDHPASATEGAYRTADDVEGDRLLGCVENLTDLANAERLRSPFIDVIDLDQTRIESQQRAL